MIIILQYKVNRTILKTVSLEQLSRLYTFVFFTAQQILSALRQKIFIDKVNSIVWDV